VAALPSGLSVKYLTMLCSALYAADMPTHEST
jgi:hypothetical protein